MPDILKLEKRSLDDDTFVPDIQNLEKRCLDDDTFIPAIINFEKRQNREYDDKRSVEVDHLAPPGRLSKDFKPVK